MNHLMLVLKLLRMEERNTNYNSESSYDWVDQRWYCGIPDGRCPSCGLPEMFPPSCLGMEVCRCQAEISKTFTLEVSFSRIRSFRLKIIAGKIPLLTSQVSHQFTFSGRTLLARNGNNCRSVWEASPRAHGGGLSVVVHRLRRFNFPRPPAPAGVKPQRIGANNQKQKEQIV